MGKEKRVNGMKASPSDLIRGDDSTPVDLYAGCGGEKQKFIQLQRPEGEKLEYKSQGQQRGEEERQCSFIGEKKTKNSPESVT